MASRTALAAACLAVLLPCVGCAPRSFVVTERGRRPCSIVVGEGSAGERLALAKDLQHWLREITGATLPLETGAKPSAASGIILALADELPRRAKRERLDELGPEGFVVRSQGDRLWLLANTELGLQHAVYAFLDHLGCRWFFPDPVWTIVSKRPDLTADVHIRAKPAFDFRRIWYGWGHRTKKLRDDHKAWYRHNRQLGHFTPDCGHAYERYVPHREFDKHPEWFALVDGKRQAAQICVSNPDVQQRMIGGVLAAFRKDPKRNMVSVEPNDGKGYCECDECRKLGGHSDGVFHLANVVAKAVRRELPGKWVGLLAYAFHSDPPTFAIEPGVYIQVTTGFRYTKLSFDEQVTAFRRLGAKLGVYDYFSVYPWDYDMPGAPKASRVYQLAEGIRTYHKLGLSTYDAESSCNWGPNGLGYWMASKLMWQPSLGADALVNDFCTRAFGRAAQPMRRLYDRWASGERFSRRGLVLALRDLEQAYECESGLGVRARLDRVAMYLHWLRLWLDYDRTARWNQGGKLVTARDEILRRAREAIVYTNRLTDTGLIHVHPTLYTSWFERRFHALTKIEGFDLKEAEAWKKERSDIPTAEEVAKDLTADLKSIEGLAAVEIEGRTFGARLVPLAELHPEAARAWGDAKRSKLFVETGVHHFVGRKGEAMRLTYTPFDKGHTVDCHWSLKQPGEEQPVAEGDVKAEKGKDATAEVAVPADGLLAFEPGTKYWRAAQIGFDVRPLSVWAGRGDQPGKPRRPPLRLWLPRLDQPLHFYVPKGTRSFVVSIAEGGWPHTTLVLRTADGQAVVEDKQVLSRDQVSVVVPEGKDGAVWSLALHSLRCVVELYDVPPYLARHPAELLVPE